MLAERPLLSALAVSLGLHLLIMSATGGLWSTSMPVEIGFPIEASLAPSKHTEATAMAPAARPAARPTPRATEPTQPPAEPSVVPADNPPSPTPEPATSPAEPPAARVESLPMPAPAVETKVEPRVDPKPEPAKPTRPALRAMPARAEIRYAVQYGEAGFTAGEARYLWQSRNGRYSLVSSLEAKGLASLFVSGRIVQVSEGEVNASGLQPEQYWLQQGDKRRDSARFLWPQNQLWLSGDRGTLPLAAQAQDLLSFPFQLAATVREGETAFTMSVSNGRKLLDYQFRVLGHERLELPGRGIDTLHIQGSRDGAGTLDVWLDMNASHLPVQIRTLDQKGKQVTLLAEEMVTTPP
jgi:hypothetical protein